MSTTNLIVLCWVAGICSWVNSFTSGATGVAVADSQPPESLRPPPCPQACRCTRNAEFGYSAECASLDLNEVPNSVDELTTFLDLSLNNITRIQRKAFSNLHLLEDLRLANNRIETLDFEAFKSLRRLKELMLHNNKIREIPARTFLDTSGLSDLNLDGNFISELLEDSFEGLHNLKNLRLDDNRLSHVPTEALSKTPNLQVLNLALNKLEIIHAGAFQHLTKLRVLVLRENKISRIEAGAFDGPTRCRYLHLEYNQLTEYPRSVTDLTELHDLTLNNNKIQRLPDRAFSKQTKLRILLFHNNPLKSVGRWTFTNLRHLTSLEIVGVNEQEHFPDLSGCNNLRELFVEGGRFIEIPDTLCGKKSVLQRLTVSNNRLQSLGGISKCNNLDGLDMRGNLLKTLTEAELKNLTSLRSLDLSNNNIKSLEKNVFSNSKLIKLNLAYNSFTLLPIHGLSQLQILNVSGVKSMLYFPPIQFMNRLTQLEAAYPYHCCQVSQEWIRAHEYEWSGSNDEIIKYNSPQIQCRPEPTSLTPCDTLLPSMVVRVVLWLVLIFSSFLNLIVVISNLVRKCRSSCRQPDRRQKTPDHATHSVATEPRATNKFVPASSSYSDTFELALCHLAFADFVAGVYIAMLVAYDVTSSGNFAEHGAWWQQSIMCRSAGFFLVMGLQLSFFTVLVATVERYMATMFPLKPEKHVSKSVLCLTLSAAWVISIATAIVTLFSGDDNLPVDERSRVLPSNNGATCLPWSTHFKYVAVLVGGHVVACLGIVILCVLMFCARRKRSWLSAQKHTRRQISLTVACNVASILPLALIGLLASAVSTYPSSAEPWILSAKISYSNPEPAKLNVDLLLTVVMLLISLRFAINPLLYISFSESFRSDISSAVRWFCCSKNRSRYHDYESDDDDGFTEPGEFAFHDPNVLRPTTETVPVFQHGKIAPDLIQRTSYETHSFGEDFVNERIYREQGNGDFQRKLSSVKPETTRFVPVMYHLGDYDVQNRHIDTMLTSPSRHGDSIHRNKNSETTKSVGPHDIEIRSAENDNDVQDVSTAYIAQGARPKYNTRLPPLIWRKYSPDDATTVDGKKLSQSCESSTSKDSGIQSEPDFGAAYSSGCSSLARSTDDSSHGLGVGHDNTDITYAQDFRERSLLRNKSLNPFRINASQFNTNAGDTGIRLGSTGICKIKHTSETVL